jgi:hypothetical protein
MRDNGYMTDESTPQVPEPELDALEARLDTADPADAPDAAEAIADLLGDQLDTVGDDASSMDTA